MEVINIEDRISDLISELVKKYKDDLNVLFVIRGSNSSDYYLLRKGFDGYYYFSSMNVNFRYDYIDKTFENLGDVIRHCVLSGIELFVFKDWVELSIWYLEKADKGFHKFDYKVEVIEQKKR